MSLPTPRADAPASAFGALGSLAPVWRWADARLTDAAEGLASGWERLRPRRRLVFVSREDGAWAGPAGVCRVENGVCAFADPRARALRGAEVEFRLAREACMVRELDLPAAAAGFLEGVVRAQLDRLTPWRADEAAFGFRAEPSAAAERIRVTVVATKRAALAPLLTLAADSITVTTVPDGAAAPLVLLSRRAGAAQRRAVWRRALLAGFGLSALFALAGVAADWTLGEALRAQAEASSAELAQRRAALLRRERADQDPVALALDTRKRSLPAAVVALEALTRALPDDAFLTEMRLSGDKLEISGSGGDVAGLIKAIEASRHFSRAKFAGPTTRGADERQSFRIEAQVAPLNTGVP